MEEESTTLEFAGKNATYDQHSLKISIRFQNWPFYALSNLLSITLDAGVTVNSTKEAGCVNTNEDESGSLRWVAVLVDNIYFYPVLPNLLLLLLLLMNQRYGQFMNESVIDGRIQTMSYYLNDDGTVNAVLPHFWEFAGAL